MIDIYSVSALDLLPPNLQQDPDMIAASETLDNDFLLVVNEAKQCILLPRIDEIEDNNLLDLLAWQMHVDFYSTTLPVKVKQELIKNSNHLHKKKGTPAAVEKAAQIVFGRSWVKEWFEYDGQPYMFKMDVEISNRGASPQDLALLDQLINAYKNKRSWLEIVNIFLTENGFIYFGSCITSGEEITVYPWSITSIESRGTINTALGTNTGSETITVYPKEAS